jgi:hypothetical protein
MRFSFPCPQCKRLLEADSERVGLMTLCEECLVSFPIPAVAANRSKTLPIQSEADLDIQARSVPVDSGWALVRLGLTLVRGSMIVAALAGMVAFVAAVIADLDPSRSGPRVSGKTSFGPVAPGRSGRDPWRGPRRFLVLQRSGGALDS